MRPWYSLLEWIGGAVLVFGGLWVAVAAGFGTLAAKPGGGDYRGWMAAGVVIAGVGFVAVFVGVLAHAATAIGGDRPTRSQVHRDHKQQQAGQQDPAADTADRQQQEAE